MPNTAKVKDLSLEMLSNIITQKDLLHQIEILIIKIKSHISSNKLCLKMKLTLCIINLILKLIEIQLEAKARKGHVQ